MVVPQKIKNITIIGSSNSTSEYLPEENKNTNLKRYMQCNATYIAPLFTTPKIQKQPRNASIDRRMGKEDVVCTHAHTHTHTQEYYSAINKNELSSFVTTQMDLEDIMFSE